MTEKRFAVTITLDVTDAETGAEFSTSTQTWADMSLKSVVGIERALHNAQDELISWSEAEVSAKN